MSRYDTKVVTNELNPTVPVVTTKQATSALKTTSLVEATPKQAVEGFKAIGSVKDKILFSILIYY